MCLKQVVVVYTAITNNFSTAQRWFMMTAHDDNNNAKYDDDRGMLEPSSCPDFMKKKMSGESTSVNNTRFLRELLPPKGPCRCLPPGSRAGYDTACSEAVYMEKKPHNGLCFI